ncbi:MAG: Gfo/Idh/MocA family oxidoreductase [Paracoccaceae bacterium]|nr:Gfo/Idh/MocA family oxidoreductase [Paracoccaceae bacterium]
MTKVAIIGLGIMGRRMLTHMCLHSAFTPELFWDPSSDACRAALAEAPDAVVPPSAEAAIAGADLVYLACPPVPRKAYALAAAGAGKALFLEKPLGVDVAESRDLMVQLEAAGVPTAVNFTQAAGDALAETTRAARSGAMGRLMGVDIVVTYGAWPREWQKEADWLRFRAEGGYVREVVSHFLFFAERVLGPLRLVHSRPFFPKDPALCETHILARLEAADGAPVSIFGSVGGAQPDRQEVTVKGALESHRITDFHRHAVSNGGAFVASRPDPDDPRAESLRRQLDELVKCLRGEPHLLSTVAEALSVQEKVEAMLAG